MLECYQGLKVLYEFFTNPIHSTNTRYPSGISQQRIFTESERTLLFEGMGLKQRDVMRLSDQVKINPQRAINLLNASFSPYAVKIQSNNYLELDIKWMLQQDYNFIVLERRSKLHQIASAKIAHKMKLFSYADTSNTQISIDPVFYFKHKAIIESYYDEIQTSLKNRNYLKLYYEDDLDCDLSGINKTFEKIDAWLNQQGIVWPRESFYFNRFTKQNKSPIEYTVKNFAELIDTK